MRTSEFGFVPHIADEESDRERRRRERAEAERRERRDVGEGPNYNFQRACEHAQRWGLVQGLKTR